jgi:hypothetical protein
MDLLAFIIGLIFFLYRYEEFAVRNWLAECVCTPRILTIEHVIHINARTSDGNDVAR